MTRIRPGLQVLMLDSSLNPKAKIRPSSLAAVSRLLSSLKFSRLLSSLKLKFPHDLVPQPDYPVHGAAVAGNVVGVPAATYVAHASSISPAMYRGLAPSSRCPNKTGGGNCDCEGFVGRERWQGSRKRNADTPSAGSILVRMEDLCSSWFLHHNCHSFKEFYMRMEYFPWFINLLY